MNKYLKKFTKDKFRVAGKALDLGAGEFPDVSGLKQMGWFCEGVDLKTGFNLEQKFKSENAPFDLVYSNYLFQKINNRVQFIETVYSNLKPGGWFFLHTFDISDQQSNSSLTDKVLEKLLIKKGFKNISVRKFDLYDEDPGHSHWHKILEVTAQK